MDRKLLIASFISLAMLSTVAMADPVAAKPEKCPCVCSIKEVGVNMVHRHKDGRWAAGQLSNQYDTKEKWTFGIGFFEAKDRAEALTKANAALKTLRLVNGPVAWSKKWACEYTNDEGLNAATITPPYADAASSFEKIVR